MRRRGASETEMLAALRVMNTERCRPPLEDEACKRIASSVARYEPEDTADEDNGTEKIRSEYATLLPGLIDVVEAGGAPAFLVMAQNGSLELKQQIEGEGTRWLPFPARFRCSRRESARYGMRAKMDD